MNLYIVVDNEDTENDIMAICCSETHANMIVQSLNEQYGLNEKFHRFAWEYAEDQNIDSVFWRQLGKTILNWILGDVCSGRARKFY